MHLSKRAQSLTQSKTSATRQAANSVKDIVNLASGEVLLPTSDQIKSAAIFAIKRDEKNYSPSLGNITLRRLIAADLSVRDRNTWSESEVGVTVGAKFGLYAAAVLLLDPGDEVIVPSPYWSTFAAQIKLVGAAPVILETSGNGFRIDVAALEKLVTKKTRALILNSPNNPTGTVLNEESILSIVSVAERHGLFIIFDECYGDFTFDSARHLLPSLVCPTIKEQLLVIGSYSKAYAIAGWRIGYMAGPAPIIEALQALHSHTISSCSTISQFAAVASFEGNSRIHLGKTIEYLAENRRVGLELLSLQTKLRVIPPEGGIYLFADVSQWINTMSGLGFLDADGLAEYLLRKWGVAVMSGSAFGYPMGLRISFALPREDFIRGMQRILAGMAELSE